MIRGVLLFLLLGGARFEHLDECPNPVMESMNWRPVVGVAIEVTSPRTFRLRKTDGEVVDVRIANLGERAVPNAMKTLKRRIEGKRVTLFLNPSSPLTGTLTGEVQDARNRDIALPLLRAGTVSYEDAPAYSLTGYSECLHRIAEREAKQHRAGLWAR